MKRRPKLVHLIYIYIYIYICYHYYSILGFTSESLVELREISENRQPIGHRAGSHIFRVQKGGNPEVLLGCSEGQLVVPIHIILVQAVEVTANRNKIGT